MFRLQACLVAVVRFECAEVHDLMTESFTFQKVSGGMALGDETEIDIRVPLIQKVLDHLACDLDLRAALDLIPHTVGNVEHRNR